jgi:hypothetical protein
MSGADILMVVVVSGIGLSGVYLGAEYARWRKYHAAKQNEAESFRALDAERASRREHTI